MYSQEPRKTEIMSSWSKPGVFCNITHGLRRHHMALSSHRSMKLELKETAEESSGPFATAVAKSNKLPLSLGKFSYFSASTHESVRLTC